MNSHNEHITHYSAADIQRYVQGKLSPEEMHAIEKAALDDPFLADAIEGMQQALHDHDETAVTGQLQQLQDAFATRTATGKKAPAIAFRWWPMAAAAVVLIITGVWIFTLFTNTPNRDVAIARTEETKQKAPAQTEQSEPVLQNGKELSVATDSTSPAPLNATAPGKNSYSPSPHQKAAATRPSSEETAHDLSVPAHRQTDTAVEDIAHHGTLKPEQEAVVAAETREPSVAAKAPTADVAAAKKNDPRFEERKTDLITIGKHDAPAKAAAPVNTNLSGFIKGRVTDHHNNPIANATVQVPNKNNNFITDKSGIFKIPAKDSVVDVSVNVAGYARQNFRLKNNAAMNNIQLQPQEIIALNEVEIQPLKVKKAPSYRKSVPHTITQDAEPMNGWVAYEQYLQKNKKIPAAFTKAKNVAGNVIVSFGVNKKGTLSDFKIEQSLSKSFDNEAIRLIKEGPSWRLLKGRKTRVSVIVRF